MDNWKKTDSEQEPQSESGKDLPENLPNTPSDISPSSVPPAAGKSDDSDTAGISDASAESGRNDTSSAEYPDGRDVIPPSASDSNASRASSGSPYVDGFRPERGYQSRNTPYNSYYGNSGSYSGDDNSYHAVPPPYRTPYNDRPQQVKRRPKSGLIVFICIVCVFALLFLGGFAVYGLINSELGASLGLSPGNSDTSAGRDNPIKPPASSASGMEGLATTSSFVPVENAPSIHIIPAPVETTTTQAIYVDGLKVLSIGEIAKKVTPSVVGIVTAKENGTGLGSGIIMSADGYILTNAHVIEDGISYQVILDNDDAYNGTLIGADKKSDIAILKIDATDLPAAEFGDSDALEVGDLAVAIGNPSSLDLAGTTTSGIISAVDREIVVDAEGNKLKLIQTDAAINPGNSGGPLLNKYGQVIGINTVRLNSDTYEGLCFAIPTNVFQPIVDELFAYGCVHGHPSFGVAGRNVSYNQSRAFNVPMGFCIESVNEKSDAYAKGIEVGDIIVGINDENVTTLAEINLIKNTFSVGDTVTLTVYRNGETLTFDILLMDETEMNN